MAAFKMYKKSVQIAILLTAPLLSQFSSAHPGRLDKHGGHNCSEKSVSKGLCTEYHFHPERMQSRDVIVKYDRKAWPHWIDEDKDCQNTRAEILIRDSLEPVKFKRNKGCNVTFGKWLDPYTNQVFYKASDIDIDHLYPLYHAHGNGAANWTRDQKRAFANDPENLLAVEDNANQEKGGLAPHEWLPENEAFHCDYLKRWQYIKAKYGLSASAKENNFIKRKLRMCQTAP